MSSRHLRRLAGMSTYTDVYLLPVPEGRLDDYRLQAETFGAAVREHGGLSYRELRADDLQHGFARQDGEVQTVAIAEFSSRESRDEVMEKVMADPRVKELEGDAPADMSRMQYGGFRTLVEA